MRALFGVVSLLVVLAVVGVVASRQLKTVAAGAPAASAPAAEATVNQSPRQVQQQVQQDLQKAVDQAARRNNPEQ